jgi:hypothetical protein
MPVKEWAAKNCVLFLWTTDPMLENAMGVIRAWDFEFKTIGFVWPKTNRRNGDFFMGTGHWGAGQSRGLPARDPRLPEAAFPSRPGADRGAPPRAQPQALRDLPEDLWSRGRTSSFSPASRATAGTASAIRKGYRHAAGATDRKAGFRSLGDAWADTTHGAWPLDVDRSQRPRRVRARIREIGNQASLTIPNTLFVLWACLWES